jgi:hypothetical protein
MHLSDERILLQLGDEVVATWRAESRAPEFDDTLTISCISPWSNLSARFRRARIPRSNRTPPAESVSMTGAANTPAPTMTSSARRLFASACDGETCQPSSISSPVSPGGGQRHDVEPQQRQLELAPDGACDITAPNEIFSNARRE